MLSVCTCSFERENRCGIKSFAFGCRQKKGICDVSLLLLMQTMCTIFAFKKKERRIPIEISYLPVVSALFFLLVCSNPALPDGVVIGVGDETVCGLYFAIEWNSHTCESHWNLTKCVKLVHLNANTVLRFANQLQLWTLQVFQPQNS